MTNEKPPITEERRAELAAVAKEIAQATAWDMALENQVVSDDAVEEIERETLDRLLDSDD